MKLKKVKINGYKSLENFCINFTKSENINVIIGRNGSGKSNFFEAISLIFDSLYSTTKRGKTIFSYEIEYLAKGNNIFIEYTPETGVKFDINGVSAYYNTLNSRRLFPNSIFAYYSGNNNRLEEIFSGKRNSSTDTDVLLRKMLMIKESHTPLALLALYFFEGESYKNLLKKELGIELISRITIKLKKIDTEKIADKSAFSNYFINDNNKFLLDSFNDLADIQGLKSDRILITNKINDINNIAQRYGTAKNFFAGLETLLKANEVEKIEIILKKNRKNINFEDFSEGEKQFLLVTSFIQITNEFGTLFLLDEPDTYLHPKWQKELVENINKLNENANVLLTTHSPLTVGEIEEKNLHILKSGKVEPLEGNPIYLGIDGLLMDENFFGLKTVLSNKVSEELSRKRFLAYKEFERGLTSPEKIELSRLRNSEGLNSIDINSELLDETYKYLYPLLQSHLLEDEEKMEKITTQLLAFLKKVEHEIH